MTKQITPEEIPAIQIGAVIAYIIILVFGIWILESAVCDITEVKDRLAALLGIFAVASIVPWLYTRVILANSRQAARRAEHEKRRKDVTIDAIIQSLESLLSQLPQNLDNEAQDILQKLRGQVSTLATSQERAEARYQAVKWLNNFINKHRLIKEAKKIGLKNFTNFSNLSKKDRKKVEKGFCTNLKECIKWLSISLNLGREQRTDGLKKSFIIQSSSRPYIAALENLRDMQLRKYCQSDLEIEEVSKYINLLINSL